MVRAVGAEQDQSVTGLPFTDAQFFSLLELSRSDLAEVRAAVARQDWPAAKHALAEHMRHRKLPHWDFDKGSVEREADAALAHRFSSIGIEWPFGTNIDWGFNPTTQPGSKWAQNHEWTW